MSCQNSCYEATIEGCDDIVLKAALNASTPYYWTIRKSSSYKIIQRLTSTNSDGDLLIPKSELPAGYLLKGNHYSIQVRNGANYLQIENLVFGGVAYQCVIAELVKIDREDTDDSDVNVIEYKL